MTHSTDQEPKKALFSDAAYNATKQAAQYWLPALGTLYAALAALWGFPYATEVVGSIAAIDVFLGVVLGISSASYNKSDAKYDGALLAIQTPGDEPNKHTLEFNAPLDALANKDQLLLKVQNVASGTPPEDNTGSPLTP